MHYVIVGGGSAGWMTAAHSHQFGVNIKGVSFHPLWLRMRASGHPCPISDYAAAYVAAMQTRFLPPIANLPPDIPQLAYAYHFDAGLHARLSVPYENKML